MKQFENTLRQKLANNIGPIATEDHVAGFEAFLIAQRQKRRRRLAWIVLPGIAAMSLVASVLFLGTTPADQPIGSDTSVISDQNHQKGGADYSELTTTPVTPSSRQSLIATEKLTASQPDDPNITSNAVHPHGALLESPLVQPAHQVKPAAKDVSGAAHPVQQGEARESLLPRETINMALEANTSPDAIGSDDRNGLTNPVLDFRPLIELTSIDGPGLSETEKATTLVTSAIQPDFKNGPNWTTGITLGWFLARQKSDRDMQGSSYLVGLYAARDLSKRMSLTAELGFLHIDGGITFEKQSVSTLFGFNQRNQTNDLSMRKLFGWTVTLSAQYHFGRHAVISGPSATYFYGAKGDIHLAETVDDQTVMSSEQNNVWVSMDGMRRTKVDALLGYQYRMNSRFTLSILARIPLTEITTKSTQQSYAFKSTGYRPGPQVQLHYQF